ncbi:late competence development ComFB family protein [Proteiniclasticum sp. C24MP]|uniref:late competence development ComFB family protein n=1 Tax=Proteiniclasticum sp. C24MP TaxID=3374101 RepID=UPI0037551A33
MLKNHMETLVDSHLPSLIKEKSHIIACEKCQNDIKAMALNHLKPQYIMSDRGLIFTKMKELDHQFQSDIIQELVRAIQIVEDHPRHEP